jgi:hypothetical protein
VSEEFSQDWMMKEDEWPLFATDCFVSASLFAF